MTLRKSRDVRPVDCPDVPPCDFRHFESGPFSFWIDDTEVTEAEYEAALGGAS